MVIRPTVKKGFGIASNGIVPLSKNRIDAHRRLISSNEPLLISIDKMALYLDAAARRE